MTSYAGWVPTITGQLSFSLIGSRLDGGFFVNREKVNQTIPHRGVVAVAERIAKDVIAPLRWFQPERKATYVLIGETQQGLRPVITDNHVSTETDPIGSLVGTVYVFPYHRGDTARRNSEKCIQEIRKLIGANKYVGDVSVLISQINSLIESSERKNVKVLKGSYRLSRTGEVRIQTDLALVPAFAHQIYYFIKDCAHFHYHHSSSRDNILPLEVAPISDDVTWRRRTLWCLAKSVLEARREDNLDEYKHALGILAYADAFQSVLGRVYWSDVLLKYVNIGRDVFYDFNHTKKSIEALIAEKEHREDVKRTKLSISVAIIIGMVAIWVASVQTQSAACSSLGIIDKECNYLPKWIATGFIWIINYPHLYLLAGISSLFLVYWRPIKNTKIVSLLSDFWFYVTFNVGASLSRLVAFIMTRHNDAWANVMVCLFWLVLGGLLSVCAAAMFYFAIPLES